jgi:hypothetical protein
MCSKYNKERTWKIRVGFFDLATQFHLVLIKQLPNWNENSIAAGEHGLGI